MKPLRTKVLACSVILLCVAQMSRSAQGSALDDFLKQYSQSLVQANDLDRQVLEDLDPEERARVGIVSADFDGNGTVDAAVLTRGGNNRSDLVLQFVLCTNTCAERQRFSVGTFNGFQYLSELAPGVSLEDLSDERDPPRKAISLVNAAVRMNEYARGHSTYYWNNATTSIEEVATGD